ncbi:hypothetical protein [Streptomyces sp. NPDC059916]|uniref:hypothetical protein n=1 Tax=Streptomyces sp. NPDC059916 TaxID=3347001 RepID=UPI00369D453F
MTAIVPERPTALDALEAGFLIVPGINRWLGKSDFQQSLDSGLTESFEDFCNRISKQEAS